MPQNGDLLPTPMTKLSAVIFDLDDTLYPEREYALSGFSAVARWAEGEFGVPHAEGYAALKQMFEAGIRGDTFNRWLAERSLPEQPWIPEMVREYREHMPELKPFDDAVPLLDRLRERYRLALITQGYGPGQQRKLEALKLTQYFESIVIMGEDQREHWKPSSRPFERALSELEVPAHESAYIGDNPVKDFLGARQLGMKTVWVRRSGGEHAAKEPPTPEHTAELEIVDLTSVPAALEQLFQ